MDGGADIARPTFRLVGGDGHHIRPLPPDATEARQRARQDALTRSQTSRGGLDPQRGRTREPSAEAARDQERGGEMSSSSWDE